MQRSNIIANEINAMIKKKCYCKMTARFNTIQNIFSRNNIELIPQSTREHEDVTVIL